MKKLITQRQYDSRVAEAAKPEFTDWLDKQDVLTLMHISASTLQVWRSKKILPFARIGAKIYYRKSDLLKLLEESIEV
ncbi:MAG: helix-turn-helix domain-containing protein [Chitinophagaceae bacterium]